MSGESASDPLPISLIMHTAFCPRRAWLEAAGEKVASINIEEGSAAHHGVDLRADDRVARRQSVDVASSELGIVGRCDVVVDSPRGLEVVEYKSAPGRRTATVTPAQRVQLALQGLCLAESGHSVARYGIYFTTSRRFVEVPLVAKDFDEARELVRETRAILERGAAPPPLVDDPRCGRCSHAGVCLPDERAEAPVHRRILVRDPDSSVLHLTTPGSRASLRSGRIKVVRGDEELASVPLERVDSVVVHGNVDLSGALIRELLWRNCPVVWASGRGNVVGFASSAKSPNGNVRMKQRGQTVVGDLPLARELIAAKIANQATILRRFSRGEAGDAVREIRLISRQAAAAESVQKLLGLEGEAAAFYFQYWPPMLRSGEFFAMHWRGRTGRGAQDPLNVALNVVYGLLLADAVRSLLACGLDPHAGFVHSSSRNKPALALDLMEQFRPVIADSVVLTAVNNGELRESMFTDVLGGYRLRDAGRRALVAGYERRVQQDFTHPVFGYRVSWRRAMEIQGRMVMGVVDGTQPRYVGVRVR